MTIVDMAPYIMGKTFTREMKQPYRCDMTLYQDICDKVMCSITAIDNLRLYEVPKQFYESEPDIANFVPKEARAEIFFSMKNGFASPVMPARGLYLIRRAYSLYKIPNLIFKLIPKSELNCMFQENYVGSGYTLYDVVCSICNTAYVPLAEGRYKVKYGNYYEVYIPKTDMVAVLPVDIAEVLEYSDICNIECDKQGLKLGDKYLAFMCNHIGAGDSNYDYRTFI